MYQRAREVWDGCVVMAKVNNACLTPGILALTPGILA